MPQLRLKGRFTGLLVPVAVTERRYHLTEYVNAVKLPDALELQIGRSRHGLCAQESPCRWGKCGGVAQVRKTSREQEELLEILVSCPG